MIMLKLCCTKRTTIFDIAQELCLLSTGKSKDTKYTQTNDSVDNIEMI